MQPRRTSRHHRCASSTAAWRARTDRAMLQAMTRSQSRAESDADGGAKQPFDIDVVMERLREAVRPFPKAAMFELAEQGYSTLFQQTVACMISIRTRDEVSGPAARRLFARAPGPVEVAALSPDEIAA